MPGSLRALGRLTRESRSVPIDSIREKMRLLRKELLSSEEPHAEAPSSGLFSANNNQYGRILDREAWWDKKISDLDFDAMHDYAMGDLDGGNLQRLMEQYSIPSPPALLRGDTGNDLVGWGRTNRPLSTTVSQPIAEEFADAGGGASGSELDSDGDYHSVLNRLNSYSVKDPAERARVLPVPISGQSEFVLAPYSKYELMEDLPADEDEIGLIRRLFRLRKQHGGPVKAP